MATDLVVITPKFQRYPKMVTKDLKSPGHYGRAASNRSRPVKWCMSTVPSWSIKLRFAWPVFGPFRLRPCATLFIIVPVLPLLTETRRD